MKILLLFLLVLSCGKSQPSQTFPPQWTPEASEDTQQSENDFNDILEVQHKAIVQMDQARSLPLGFTMTEMVTDIAVSKKGLVGLSALKANNGVEIKWKKRQHQKNIEEDQVDFSIDESANVMDLSQSVLEMAKTSGKVKVHSKLKEEISNRIDSVKGIFENIDEDTVGSWKLSGLRFDLNFSATGKVSFINSVGGNFRVRMEWKLIKSKTKNTSPSPETKFIQNTLTALNKVTSLNSDFSPKKISIGVGMTYKKEIGIWKYSAGFIGFLAFIPVQRQMQLYPLEQTGTFLLGGHNETSLQEHRISSQELVRGLQKSLQTASVFIKHAEKLPMDSWYIAEIKTINDITYTGLFGLADFTTKGAIEIDFKRN